MDALLSVCLPWMGSVSHVDFQGHREAELKQWRYTTQRRPQWLHGDVSTSIFTHLTWLPELQLPQITYEIRMWMEMIWVLFGPFSLSHQFQVPRLLISAASPHGKHRCHITPSPLAAMAAMAHLHLIQRLQTPILRISNGNPPKTSEKLPAMYV